MVKHIHIQYSLFAACVWCYALRRIVFFIPYFCHKSNSLKLCISTTHFHLYESFALAVIKLPQIHLNTQSHIILYLPFSVSTVTKNSIESTVEQKKKKENDKRYHCNKLSAKRCGCYPSSSSFSCFSRLTLNKT